MGENHTFSDLNEQCFYEELSKLRHKEGILYCPAFHDSLNCLPFTEANSTIRLPCPPQLNAPVHVYGVRTCGLDGNWTGQITDYSACVHYFDAIHSNQTTTESSAKVDDEYDLRLAEILRDIYFITSIVSLLFLVITLFIFCYFRSLHCNRISIHKHLVVSFIIRFIVTIVMLEPVVFQHIEFSYLAVDLLCKIMRSFEKYTVLTNMYWMLVEGIYLHNNLVATVFSTEAPFKLFIFIGWIFPAIPTVAWAVAKELTNPSYCWHEYDNPDIKELNAKLNFILLTPLLIALALNLIFLINIIRVLVTKLRAKNTHESSRIKKAIRATIILLPLLGLTNLLFIYNPEDGGSLQMVYHVTNALIQGMQGVLISIFYCFLNGEVKRVLRRKYRRFRIKYHLKNSGRRRSSWTSSFVMSQTETRNSSSTDSNHGIPAVPANNNRYIKADLILEVCDETRKRGSDCQSCENIHRLDEYDEKNKVNINIKPARKDSAKLNNVHFAMEGDKVKCETFPLGTSCSRNFEKSMSATDKPNNLDVENARKESLKRNCIEHTGSVDVENSRNENIEKNTLDKYKNTTEAEKKQSEDTDTNNSLCDNEDSKSAQNEKEPEYSNRFSTFSLGEGMFGIVDGFADDVSEEITRLLQT